MTHSTDTTQRHSVQSARQQQQEHQTEETMTLVVPVFFLLPVVVRFVVVVFVCCFGLVVIHSFCVRPFLIDNDGRSMDHEPCRTVIRPLSTIKQPTDLLTDSLEPLLPLSLSRSHHHHHYSTVPPLPTVSSRPPARPSLPL